MGDRGLFNELHPSGGIDFGGGAAGVAGTGDEWIWECVWGDAGVFGDQRGPGDVFGAVAAGEAVWGVTAGDCDIGAVLGVDVGTGGDVFGGAFDDDGEDDAGALG